MVVVEGRIELGNALPGCLVRATGNDTVRADAVVDRRAYTGKLGIGDYAAVQHALAKPARLFASHRHTTVAVPPWSSGLVVEGLVAVHRPGDPPTPVQD